MTETWNGIYVVNEDRYLCDEEAGLFAVLDGEYNGGHAADVALGCLDECRRGLSQADAPDVGLGRKLLEDAVSSAAKSTYDAATSKQYRGEGTSLTCCVFLPTAVVVAHIGDARLYHLTEGVWTRVTEDDSLVEQLRALGDAVALKEAQELHSTAVETTG